MERPKNIIETKEYTEPHTFESDKEATLFYAYIESEKYIDYLLESTTKLIEIEKRKYAVDELYKLLKLTIPRSIIEGDISSRISELEQEIIKLETELK